MLFNEVFGHVLSEVRKSMNVTQEELAERSGLSRAYISRLERNINDPQLLTVFKLSEGLHIDIVVLISKYQALIKEHKITLEDLSN